MAQEITLASGQVHQVTMPSLRRGLNLTLLSAKRNRIASGEFDGLEENPLWSPPLLPKPDYDLMVRNDIPKHEAYLQPASPKWINQRVVAMLSHYFIPDVPAPAQLAALADWVRLLSPFPQWAVQAAVDEWLSRPGRQKPMPGDIIAACRWRVEEPALNLKLLRKLAARYEQAQLGGPA